MVKERSETWLDRMWIHKIPQYLGTYLAVGFGVLQFVAFVTSRYSLNENLVDKYLIIWLGLTPAVLMIIHSTGLSVPKKKTSRSKWSKILIFCNVIVALLLGIFLFNENTSNQSKMLELTNDEGQIIKASVPSLNRVKSIASFQFENLTENTEHDWLGYAFSKLLKHNLEQRPEFYVYSAFGLLRHYDAFGLSPSKQPNIGMQREVARKSRNEYFSRISYKIENDQFVLEGDLYDTSTGKAVLSISATNMDPYKALDEVTLQIFDNIPNGLDVIENQISLPSSALITENIGALRYLIESRLAFFYDPSGLEEVLQLAQKAVEQDPSCAICHYYVGDPMYGLGRVEEATQSIKKAIKYGKSNPERMQFGAKETLYMLTNNSDGYLKLQELRRKLFPYEFAPYYSLLDSYKSNYGIDSAMFLIEEAIDNGNLEKGLLELYQLQIENEDFGGAKLSLDRYSLEFPDREKENLKYVSLYIKQGKLIEARKLLVELETLAPLDVDVQLKLAYLDFKELDFSNATYRIEQGLKESTSLTDSLSLIKLKIGFLQKSGQIYKAIDLLEEHEKLETKRSPINRIVFKNFTIKNILYLSIGQAIKMEELVSEIIKYSPTSEALYRCVSNSLAIERGYETLMNNDEYTGCLSSYKSYGSGYTGYVKILSDYQKGNYEKCVVALDSDSGKIEKLFSNKFFLIEIYSKAGNIDRAKEITKKMLDAKTEFPIYYYFMAELLERDNIKESKKYLDIALQFWSNADSDFIPLQKAKKLEERLLNHL